MTENIYSHYQKELAASLSKQGYDRQAQAGISLSPPREKAHGDMATNAAFILGKALGESPQAVAQKLVGFLAQLEGVEKVEVAGAAFINLFLKAEVWHRQVKAILEQGAGYGKSSIGAGQKVNIEFVSANPTGPLHIGHARGAIFGDVLAALMENAGYAVEREYYINDEGVQIDILARSLLLRMEGKEIPQGQDLYPGEYLKDIAAGINKDILACAPEERHQKLRAVAIEKMMALVKEELARLNIRHDNFFYESTLHKEGLLEKVFNSLKEEGLVYEGVLPPPKGKEDEHWEAEEQWLFRSSQFGDDGDRTMKKADGTWTYFAGDVAYHYDKVKRGYNILINVFGSDHSGYVKRLSSIVEALSQSKVRLSVCLMHLVRIVRKGKAEYMSKRAGNFLGLSNLLDEIGADALRFIMLTRKNEAPLDIDIELLKEQTNDNPVFYVQYAHARCCSVLREAGEEAQSGAPSLETLANLQQPSELALIKTLSLYPNEVALAALDKTPHRLAFYLQELAAAFHTLWNQGKENRDLKFIALEPRMRQARLCLVQATKQVLSNGLNLMGIEPIEEL